MKLSLVIILSLIGVTLNAQKVSISGKVVDSKTGEPIPGANVYLANTVSGASTEVDGTYSFSTELEGTFSLVATFVGYKSESKPIILENGDNQTFDFELNENIVELNEIVVKDSNKEWLNQLSQFKDFFLGTDDFASQTTILNPEMINFNKESGKLRATNLEPIVIDNNALGYNITVEFENVVFDPVEKTGFYVIYPRFAEMKPNNKREEREWKRNREKSYEGSSRHFFRSLFEDKVRSNRFTIYPNRKVIEEHKDPRMLQSLYGGNWRYVYRNYSTFLIKDMNLTIGHNLKLGRGGKPMNPEELSSLFIKGNNDLIVINEQGLLYNPALVELRGKWSLDRFSKYLPIDYKP